MKINYIYIFALLLSTAGCSSKKEVGQFVPPVFYEKVGQISSSSTLSFPGVVQSSQEPRLSFKVAGTIDNLRAKLGDTLKKGAVIATLDNSDYALNYNRSLSALKGAEANFVAAKAAFARVEKLYINGNLSISDYEKSKMQLASTESMRNSAVLQVEGARNQLDYTYLRAPFSGIVSALFVKEREIVGAGMPIAVLSGLSAIEVKTSVPENLIGKIKRGDSVNIYLNSATDKRYCGVIKELSLGVANTQAYPVVIEVNNPVGELFSGMSVMVEMVVQNSEAVEYVVSAHAVAHDYSGDHVYVAVKDSLEEFYHVSKRGVVLGDLKQSGYVILDGLERGELVITAGLSYLFEGKKVRLIL